MFELNSSRCSPRNNSNNLITEGFQCFVVNLKGKLRLRNDESMLVH